MSETLREIQSIAVSQYSEYRHEYYRYNASGSITQRKILQHTRDIGIIHHNLLRLASADENKIALNGMDMRTEMLQNDLRSKQQKLDFRMSESVHGTDDIVSRSRQFYLDHDVQFIRLALIEAELDGIAINL